MKTCGTCKHFGDLVDGLDQYGVGENGKDMPNKRFHKCKLLEHMNADRPFKLDGTAGVIDGSGYHAVFCVSEEFGCNQHAVRTGSAT
jgi:hypothetical protein